MTGCTGWSAALLFANRLCNSGRGHNEEHILNLEQEMSFEDISIFTPVAILFSRAEQFVQF